MGTRITIHLNENVSPTEDESIILSHVNGQRISLDFRDTIAAVQGPEFVGGGVAHTPPDLVSVFAAIRRSHLLPSIEAACGDSIASLLRKTDYVTWG